MARTVSIRAQCSAANAADTELYSARRDSTSRKAFLTWVAGLSLFASTIVAQEATRQPQLQPSPARSFRQSGQPQTPQPQPNMKMVSIEVVIADYTGGKTDEGEKSQAVENPVERLKLLEK